MLIWRIFDEIPEDFTPDEWAAFYGEKRKMRAEDEATDPVEDENGYSETEDVQPGMEGYR